MKRTNRLNCCLTLAGLLLISAPLPARGQTLTADSLGQGDLSDSLDQAIVADSVTAAADLQLLTETVNNLQREQKQAERLARRILASRLILSKQDSLEIKALKRQESAIRARIDMLTMQLLWISERLQDPRTRRALAKKIQTQRSVIPKTTLNVEPVPAPVAPPVTARSIDLASVNLIRDQGLSLDQARLQVIEQLSPEQISNYYASLSREERYALYDIIDAAVLTDAASYDIARKSAIFFHLYAK